MRLLICAGGTGGGVYPALSVLQALQRENSQGQLDGEVLWVGGENGLEADLVKRERIPYRSIPAAGIHGVGLRALPGNLSRLGRGVVTSRRILGEFRPDVLLFTGGYVAVPMALAARLGFGHRRRPRILVFVPDIEPGWALKVLVRMADQVALTVEESQAFLPSGVGRTVTGYPTRQELTTWTRSTARSHLDLAFNQPVFLVMGGSRGARSINQALFAALPQLLTQMQVLHISGQQTWEEVERIRGTLPVDLAGRYHPYPYLHARIGAALAASDLVLSRAGASSLGEYPLFGLPAVLAPYPFAWRYQRVNADYLVRQGAALQLQDNELMAQLASTVLSLMADSQRRRAMAQAMAELTRPAAARSIAQILAEMAEKAS